MIDISPEIFEVAYQKFNNLFEGEITKAKIELKDHPLMSKHENYKYEIINDAKEALLLKIWKESDIGSGRILGYIKDAINVKSNNLIDWRKKDDFKKLAANLKNEKFLYDFFKSKIDDGNAFDNFVEIGFSYQLIAYLYFIKNYQRYIPISQEQFDKIFSSLSIDFKTSHNISWENYLQFNEIIKQFRRMLSDRYNNVSLLDAHSFLWIYGFQLDNEKGEAESEKLPKSEIEEKSEIHKPEHKPKLDTYQPKKVVDLHSLKEESSEIDYLENHRKLMEIGELAERIVYESERNFLEQHSPELVKKVRLVSNNPKLGFDILSQLSLHFTRAL